MEFLRFPRCFNKNMARKRHGKTTQGQGLDCQDLACPQHHDSSTAGVMIPWIGSQCWKSMNFFSAIHVKVLHLETSLNDFLQNANIQLDIGDVIRLVNSLNGLNGLNNRHRPIKSMLRPLPVKTCEVLDLVRLLNGVPHCLLSTFLTFVRTSK